MANVPFYPDGIPIVFSSNDYFVPYMSTMIQSVMETAKTNRRYCFYILYNDLSEKNMVLLKKQISRFPLFSVDFINVSDFFSGYNLFVSGYISLETYFRLLIPYLFSDYDKVLYLDGDMICRTDIAALFDINLEDYLLAAVWDTIASRYFYPDDKDYIKLHHVVSPYMKNPSSYFNGGLIIFNINIFRNFISVEKLFELAQSREWPLHDQDILNFLAEGRTLLLPYRWNFMYSPRYRHLPDKLHTEYTEAKENPQIIHFKPWDRDNYIPFFEYFWMYAFKTPFIEIIVERMIAKGLISDELLPEKVLSNITYRKGIGIKFILIDCIKAWLFRKKKKEITP